MPRVSISVPCYNYAHYLQDAVQSILNQSFRDWEAITIDDASTDSTWEVMQGFRDPRIVCVRHTQNKGNIVTFNLAIARSSGEYVAILSADDLYRPNFLKRTVEMLEAHPDAGMVYTGWEMVDARGRTIREVTSMPHAQDGVYDELPSLLLGCHIPQCGTLVRRRVLDQVGVYDPTLIRAGDWDLWLRIARRYKVAFVSEALYQYRRHGGNMSVDPGTLLRTEQELNLILERVLSDASLPPEVRATAGRARAYKDWGVARLRFMRKEWRGGTSALLKAVCEDPALVSSPRRVAGMILSAAHGLTGRTWWGI